MNSSHTAQQSSQPTRAVTTSLAETDDTTDDRTPVNRSLAPRAVIAGLAIGVLINLSNTYYGLRIGVASQMSMVSSLLGFAGFTLLSRWTTVEFSPSENVLIVSVATATGAMPVTAGFVGVIPALEYLIGPEDGGPLVISWAELVLWSAALCFFGLLFASWLRPYFIERQKLPWPGARATANLINTLHHKSPASDPSPYVSSPTQQTIHKSPQSQSTLERQPLLSRPTNVNWNLAVNWLIKGASVSGLLTIIMFFIPILHNFPIFGTLAAKNWLWSIDLSPGFIGQGIITGPIIPIHMLVGAVVGWGILSPYAKTKGYAPGEVDDWENGSRGWIIWVSLAALLADASVKLAWFILQPAYTVYFKEDGLVRAKLRILRRDAATIIGLGSRETAYHALTTDDQDPSTLEHPIQETTATPDPAAGELQEVAEKSLSFSVLGLILMLAIILCCLAMQLMFGKMMKWYYTMLAILLSLPMAVVGIRSLAETDYNPESAIVSQLVFASIVPHSHPSGIIINLLSAAVAQAGANQSGDLSYDLKIGQLVGARPDVQTWGQIIGSVVGAVISCSIYRLYASQYTIPGPFFRVPSSFLVLSTARLLMGRGLPLGVTPFAVGAAILSATVTIMKMRYAGRWWEKFLPSGVAFAIGIYNTPSFMITRAIGGLLYWMHQRRNGGQAGHSVIFASGLLLGESLASLVTIAMTAANVPQLGGVHGGG